MSDWIFQDYAAMLQHILQTHPDYAKVVIGHMLNSKRQHWFGALKTMTMPRKKP